MIKYIDVVVLMTKDGKMHPKELFFDDNHFYIDKIIEVVRLASTKGGGSAIRYLCRIKGKERSLFLDNNRWFVELIDT